MIFIKLMLIVISNKIFIIHDFLIILEKAKSQDHRKTQNESVWIQMIQRSKIA